MCIYTIGIYLLYTYSKYFSLSYLIYIEDLLVNKEKHVNRIYNFLGLEVYLLYYVNNLIKWAIL